MISERFIASPSGVQIATDFRDNLIIDRFDPVFATMRAAKLKHLRSENSEDAITWNVFRSLRQIDPRNWLRELLLRALPVADVPQNLSITVDLWKTVAPPLSLLESGDEGDSEVDVVIESSTWVWFIEAKFRSDISSGTTTRPTRDQILRNIDVGSYYAGVRDFYFSLLVRDDQCSPMGAGAVTRYSELDVPRAALRPHRPDGLANLRSVSMLTWADLGSVLMKAQAAATREDEKGYAERAVDWIQSKGLLEG